MTLPCLPLERPTNEPFWEHFPFSAVLSSLLVVWLDSSYLMPQADVTFQTFAHHDEACPETFDSAFAAWRWFLTRSLVFVSYLVRILRRLHHPGWGRRYLVTYVFGKIFRGFSKVFGTAETTRLLLIQFCTGSNSVNCHVHGYFGLDNLRNDAIEIYSRKKGDSTYVVEAKTRREETLPCQWQYCRYAAGLTSSCCCISTYSVWFPTSSHVPSKHRKHPCDWDEYIRGWCRSYPSTNDQIREVKHRRKQSDWSQDNVPRSNNKTVKMKR